MMIFCAYSFLQVQKNWFRPLLFTSFQGFPINSLSRHFKHGRKRIRRRAKTAVQQIFQRLHRSFWSTPNSIPPWSKCRNKLFNAGHSCHVNCHSLTILGARIWNCSICIFPCAMTYRIWHCMVVANQTLTKKNLGMPNKRPDYMVNFSPGWNFAPPTGLKCCCDYMVNFSPGAKR